MVKPVLCGHDCVPKWCLDFLRGWHEVDGQWTTSTDHWTRFMTELVETLCHTTLSKAGSMTLWKKLRGERKTTLKW